MKKTPCLIFALQFISIMGISQSSPHIWEPAKARSSMASGGFVFPIGDFSETHFAGLGVKYSWSPHRFGTWFRGSSHRTGLIVSGGVDHYFGKKDDFGFRYFGLTYLHILPGIIFTPHVNGNISLSAGPALSLYKDDHRLGFETELGGNYFLKNNFSFVYALRFIKHHNENVRWIFGFGGGYCF